MDEIIKIIEQLTTSSNLDFAVLLFSSSLFVGGIIIHVWKDLIDSVRLAKKKHREKTVNKKESKIDRHLRDLVEANFGADASGGFYLKLATTILFLFFLILAGKVLWIGTAFVIALSVAIIPYLILRVRLENIRGQSSHEGELLVSQLLIKYRTSNYNIEEAIESLLLLKGLAKTNVFLSRLLLSIRNAQDDNDLKKAIHIFQYSVGTNWAKVLASNIYQATTTGINVTASLEDILIQLREARKLWEEQVRNTSEPRRMMWSIPVLYAIFMVVALYYIEMPLKDYLYNQFCTTRGVTFFSIMTIGFGASCVLVALLFSRKFDY